VDDLSLVRDHAVPSVVAGSRAYGLATEASDVDRRGVFVTPTPPETTSLGEELPARRDAFLIRQHAHHYPGWPR
jgi:hypothetical protein